MADLLLRISLIILSVCYSSAARSPTLKQCSAQDFVAAVEHLGQILTFRTISEPTAPNHALHPEEFHKLDAWLSSTYPAVWEAFQVEKVGADGMSYLLTWQGRQPALRPVLFISHTDVVPVAGGDKLKEWLQPPFSGTVAGGYIWGRGAQDVKLGVVGLMEAATGLLAEGYVPVRTLMFAFGHDEEVGGQLGAAQTAALLTSRGIELEMIVDEGIGIASDGVAPFTTRPVALVGTAEKELHSVQVTVHSVGGHSSKPPIDGSSVGAQLGRLLSSVTRRPPPARLVSPTKEFVQRIADLAPAWLSPLLRAVNVFPTLGWLMAQIMAAASPEAAALVRSTAVVTRVAAGVAHNVLPASGAVTINFRLLPGDTREAAAQHVRAWLGSAVAAANISWVSIMPRAAAAAVANASGPHFALLASAIQETWLLEGPGEAGALPVLPVLPMLLPAMTDSRHYSHLCPNGALRWTPSTFSRAGGELHGIHGVNERISLDDFACGLVTFKALLQKFGDYVGDGEPVRPQQQQQREEKQQKQQTDDAHRQEL